MTSRGITFARSLWCIVLFFGAAVADSDAIRGDEGVERSGTKHRGRLEEEQGVWRLRREGQPALPLTDLAYVRFEASTTPFPRTPTVWTLHLHHDHQISGTLLSVTQKDLAFATSWGQRLTLNREQVVGVASADDAVLAVRDDFETNLDGWQLMGKPSLSFDRPFFGKSSLMFDAPRQSAARSWPPLVGDGTVRLYAYAAADAKPAAALELLIGTKKEPGPTISIDALGHHGANVKRTWTAKHSASTWRLLAFERRGDRLRLFVDDHCVGDTTVDVKTAVTGLRVSSEPGAGKFWIDELTVSRRVPTIDLPAASTDQDLVWLDEGEQLFGRIVSADAKGVVLDAKFGKRTIGWSKMRGIFFARSMKPAATDEPEITFRPGPGSSLDRLRGKLTRWENGKLIVRHAIFGEIALERERLDKVRFETK